MNLSVPKGNISLSLNIKAKLAQRAAHHREKWMEDARLKPKAWSSRQRKWVQLQPKWGYLRRTVDENFPSLVGKPNDVSTLFSLIIYKF